MGFEWRHGRHGQSESLPVARSQPGLGIRTRAESPPQLETVLHVNYTYNSQIQYLLLYIPILLGIRS